LGPIAQHTVIVGKPGANLSEDICRMCIRRFDNSVVNPFSLATSSHNSRSPQVGEVPGDLRLICLQHFNKEANTQLLVADQIDKPQTRPIGERSK
jgi:hypothetical protein